MKRGLAAVVLGGCVAAHAPPAPRADDSPLRFDVAAIDRTQDPCTSFYDYACGDWRKTHPIPADRSRWNRYAELDTRNAALVHTLVDGAAQHANGPTEARVGAYYAACMDAPAIDARGLAPLAELLARIDAVATPRAAQDAIVELQRHGVSALFDVSVSRDPSDVTRNRLELGRGALGLPKPNEYTASDERAVTLRRRYLEHVQRVLTLLGDTEAASHATSVLELETTLAKATLTPAEQRDTSAQQHAATIAELAQRYPALDWPSYFAGLGVTPSSINVAEPRWLSEVDHALRAPDLSSVRTMMRLLVVRRFAAVLPHALDEEQVAFDNGVLRGVPEAPPRWQACLSLLDRDLGDDVGAMFLARAFSTATRQRTEALIDKMLASYREDIATRDWLGPRARAAAERKLEHFLIVLGGTNRPRALDRVVIDRADAFGNAWRARALAVRDELDDLPRAPDREKFFDELPQSLDGFGSKMANATGFTAGFLQPPIFDPRMDDAVNYGAFGSVIGHELTHHFDDEGRKYDELGRLAPWWDAPDVERFEQRAQCFVDEYKRFTAEDGTPLDTKLELGENVADNGGIRLSYAALHPSDRGPRIDGFTPAQRFFLAWGQIRCENVRPEVAHRLATSDPHAPGRARVDGVVSNMPEFAHAFSCAPGTPMAPTNRCELW